MLPSSDVDLFMKRFLHRHDTYCLQQADGRYTRRYAPLTRELVLDHLQGQGTLAVDSMNRHGLARWLCFDSDAPDGLAILDQIQTHLAYLGVLTLREASRRGGHLWLMGMDAVPASVLRHLAQLVLGILGITCEVYPDREFPDGVRGVAHPVRLPLGIHQVTGTRYPFLDALDRPCHGPDVASALAWLAGQPGNSLTILRMAIVELELQGTPEPIASSAIRGTKAHGIIGWVNSALDLRDVITATRPDAALRQAGKGFIGWCQWHDDAAPQADGSPGTPSLYLVHDRMHGWSWRCLSHNCGAHPGPMHHTFDWLTWHCGGDQREALTLAHSWHEEGEIA